MNILYFAFGLLAGLYLNSLFNTFISTIVNNVMTNNPDLIERIMKDKKPKSNKSTFQERIEERIAKSKQAKES